MFIRFLGPQSLHNGKVLSYQDKAVMVTRLVPTLRGSVSLQNYADSAYADTYAAMFVSGYISGPVCRMLSMRTRMQMRGKSVDQYRE